MTDKPSAPAFSMGSHVNHNKVSPNHFVPGPGAYESPSTLQISKQSTNKNVGDRFKQQVNQVPGPGSYNYHSVNSHSPCAIVCSRTKQHQSSQTQAPGPGAYQPNYRKVVKAEGGFKIGQSAKIGDIVGEAKKTPGPTNYQTNKSTLLREHGVKIGTQKRTEMVLNNFSPGPGQYQDKNLQEITLRHNPKISFGKAGRSYSTNNLIPGPGSYTYNDRFQEGMAKSKGFSISSKHKEIATFATKVPGPGAYSTNEWDYLKHKSSSYSIGKAQKLRMDNEKELLTLPGPEKYNITKGAFDHRSALFGKEHRNSPPKDVYLPGPGAYESKLQTHLPQFSIPKSNTSWVKPSFTPGPGAYEAKNGDNNNYNSIKIKQDERKPFYDEKKWVPGPGSYSSSQAVNKAISYKQTYDNGRIGTQKRGEIKASNSPGPGNYTIPSTVSNVPKYSH